MDFNYFSQFIFSSMASGLDFFGHKLFIGGSWGYNKIKNKLKMKIVVIYKLILIAIKADISKIIYFLTYC